MSAFEEGRELWVLTQEFNEYYQQGEYFVAVYLNKPTKEKLVAAGVPESTADFVLLGGGRKGVEYNWYHLRPIIVTG